MINQVTNGFPAMSPVKLTAKTRFILTEMEANIDYFPLPTPALKEVAVVVDAFEVATMAAENGDRVAIAFRKEKSNELIFLLRKLGCYVNLVADGNRTIALASGFDVAKERTPTPAITHANTPVLKAGVNAGDMVATCKSVKGGQKYQYYISTDVHLPITQWKTFAPSTVKQSFTNLESGKRYYVKVAALGKKSQMVYSEVASLITQ